MGKQLTLLCCALLLLAGCAHSTPVHSLSSSEGMWLPNALPVDRLKSQFNFSPTPEWLDHLRLASVNIGA
jgi:hypothetical protein